MISNFYVLAIVCIFLSNASEETDERLIDSDDIYMSFENSENENDSVENKMTPITKQERVEEETDDLKEIREMSLKRFVKAMDEIQLENAENPELKSDQSVEKEEKDEVLECYICNEEMNEKFQYCEHPTHATCLVCAEKWKDSCPMCRNEFGGSLKKSDSPRIQNHFDHLPEILLDLSRVGIQIENAVHENAICESRNDRVMRDREEMELNNAILESLHPIHQNRDAPRSNFLAAHQMSKCFQCRTEPATSKKSPGDVYGFCESCVIGQIMENENIGRENNILNPNRPRRRNPSIFCRIFCCHKTKPANQNPRLNKM